jgi:hypothetical protein
VLAVSVGTAFLWLLVIDIILALAIVAVAVRL